MKNIFIVLTLLALSLVGVNAQTNTTTVSTNVVATNGLDSAATLSETNVSEGTKYDLTLGGGGFIVPNTGAKETALDVSLSANPFKDLRQLWVGVAQSVAWSPTFAGYTGVDADWNVNVTDSICVLGGWNAGAVYAVGSQTVWQTGPEVIGQYYTSDTSYIYVQGSYELQSKGDGEFDWSIGIGIEF